MFSETKVLDFEKASELSLEECVRSRLSKIKKNHPELLEKEQKALAKQRCETRPKGDFTLDYPVQGYTRGGKPVKAHERGIGKKEEVLAKVEQIKKLEKNIEGQTVQKIVRQSDGYYLYLTNGARILFQRFGGKFYAIPSLTTGKMEIMEAKSLPDAIKKYIAKYNIKEEKIDLLGLSLIPIVSKVISKLITPVIVKTDSIPFSEFIQLKTDFSTNDFVVFHGPIARDGPYKYEDENVGYKTLYKTLPNLIDIYSRYDYLPIRPSELLGAHFAEEMGYGTNFCLNEETNMIEADLVLVNDDKFKEILKNKGEYHVSPGYTDIVKNNIQTITGLDHIALAFGEEVGRACTGVNEKGSSCTKVKQIYHDQNLIGGVINN